MISSNKHASSAMAQLLAPTNGVRGAQEARGVKPKNHMAAHRQALKKQQEDVKDRTDEMNNTKTDRFVMKKFQNVESRVQTSGRPGTATTRGGIPRPPGQENEAMNSARQSINNQPTQIAFGKSVRTGSASGGLGNRPPSARNSAMGSAAQRPGAQSSLTSQNLNKFNRKSNSIGIRRPTDPEVVVFTGEEAKVAAAAKQAEENPEATPVHKNYGKVPKYLEKYKEEAAELARQREELRAKKRLPPGMKKMDEAERVQTLEQLESTKRELQSMLHSLPISMRSEALRLKKRELEDRLAEVERNITTFSRKVVYIQE